MVTKNQIKLITGLQQKKFRAAHGLFVAEGAKVIRELLNGGFELESLFETEAIFSDVALAERIAESDLNKMSALTSANNCLAVFRIPAEKLLQENGLVVVLDDIRDPGNLGTLLRLCDWFGVRQLVCSQETADVYNPKVVQASMGSLARVQVNYVDLPQYLVQTNLPVFGTFMDGKNIYKASLPETGVIVLGNEANGISASAEKTCTERLAIPRFGNLQQTESLNVATAAAIVLSEFRRNN